MADGAAGFRQGFSGPALLRIPLGDESMSDTRLSRSMTGLSRPFSYQFMLPQRGPTTPELPKQHGFGLFRVRSPLLAKSFLFSLPAGT